MGVIEEGINLIRRCGNGSMSVQVTQILEWVNNKTDNCNNDTCSQDQCMTEDKLEPQSLKMLVADLSLQTTTDATNNASVYHINMCLWLYINLLFVIF